MVCGNEFKGDAKINFDIIKRMNINIDVISDIEDLKYIVRSYDIIVDAIFRNRHKRNCTWNKL